MRLQPRTRVTINGLPGVWLALYPTPDRRGWWRILCVTSTPGLEALSSYGTIDVRRDDILPTDSQETLL